MIATRAEATFKSISSRGFGPATPLGVFEVEITTGEKLTDRVTLDVHKLATNFYARLNEAPPDNFKFRGGSKLIKLYANAMDDEVDAGAVEPFEFFTPEKLIHDFGRGKSGISGFERHRQFATYDLLYVGIAKKADTYSRLFKNAHSKRLEILSNAYPSRSNSRVSDEMILFAWDVDPLVIKTWESDADDLSFTDQAWDDHRKAVIADAEKALVNLLDPEYNIEKFVRYPKGTDGLYGHGYDTYSCTLMDNVTFKTTTDSIRGSGRGDLRLPFDDADVISTSGDAVRIFRRPPTL